MQDTFNNKSWSSPPLSPANVKLLIFEIRLEKTNKKPSWPHTAAAVWLNDKSTGVTSSEDLCDPVITVYSLGLDLDLKKIRHFK